jgi:hypothetical protein
MIHAIVEVPPDPMGSGNMSGKSGCCADGGVVIS